MIGGPLCGENWRALSCLRCTVYLISCNGRSMTNLMPILAPLPSYIQALLPTFIPVPGWTWDRHHGFGRLSWSLLQVCGKRIVAVGALALLLGGNKGSQVKHQTGLCPKKANDGLNKGKPFVSRSFSGRQAQRDRHKRVWFPGHQESSWHQRHIHMHKVLLS